MLRGLVLVCEQLYYTHSRSCHGASPSHPSPPLQTQNRCTSLPARFLDTNFAKHSSYQPPCCHHSLSSVLTVRDGAWCAGITMASFTSMNNQQKPPTDDELRYLYEQVMRGFERESRSPLDDVRISSGPDDLSAFIDQYRGEDAGSLEPPSYDADRRANTGSPLPPPVPVTEKGMCFRPYMSTVFEF